MKRSVFLLIYMLIPGILFLGCSGSGQQKNTQSQTIAHNLTVEQFKTLASDTSTVILDVRTPQEFNEGHIENAELIDFYSSDFEQKLGQLDTTKTYIIYCRSGNRSNKTVNLMKNKLNFKNVGHLEGGIIKWRSAQKP